MFSIATAPAKQSATDTISVLSGRLSSATLLEDRRAAILGLRSFAKDFPATVSSSALRGLIGSLAKDGEDVDTVKVVLETLLMLFTPNEDSPEASDEVVLWLADEFTQRQENVTLLLDFLETNDFYSRLYSLQLLGAILSARTERTEECVFTAPLGISRLVSTLDDQRDAIRTEGISLLTSLTPASVDIQKLVAFENTFEKLFAIIESDGSLSEGGRTVEDCLILLANLLRRNASNQTLFRESGCMKKLADLLRSVSQFGGGDEVAIWAQAQRNRNLYAFLAILRLLLSPGSAGVSRNQKLLWKHGLCADVLHLAFSSDIQMEIRAEALIACGDMIRDCEALQESFAQLSVSRIGNKHAPSSEPKSHSQVYVIDGLLDLILNLQDSAAFNVRYAASECLKAYFSNHLNVRLHFLTRAIEGYLTGSEDATNALAVLLAPSSEQSASDPYHLWFAAIITFHLLYDNSAAKTKALSLTEGDAAEDEELVTSIQTVTAHLLTGIRRGDDARISVGYLMLLTIWLFEDLDAVNDFLSEGSNVQSLIQTISQPIVQGSEIVQGLCAMLLGTVYEFSTKDSPVPRTTLHTILTTRLDREQYLDRLLKLRSHPLLRDFETIPQRRDPALASGLADVYFDSVFVNFFKDNYSRIARALDRSPELEISVITNGVQKGISRDLVDSLREQIQEKDRAIEEAKIASESQASRLGQEQGEYRRFKEEANKELQKAQEETKREKAMAKAAQEGLQRSHEAEIKKLQSLLSAKDVDTQKQIAAVKSTLALTEAEHEKKAAALKAAIAAKDSSLEQQLNATNNERERDSQNKHVQLQAFVREADELRDELNSTREKQATTIEELRKRIKELDEQLDGARRQIDDTRKEKIKACCIESTLATSKKEKESVQSELDDLLIVFTDLEDQVAKYKKRLRELGEPVSDGEDESDDDDDVD
ncbi:Vesicle tethering protein p115-like protein [Cordyceps fumosorosea ARSEF 2679]|uniref:Vesicle tethering protein p115-like protein n=1 Tax=Cordyceps fumosorosea (strain ARSEF 2679) TaxID=1081104 RepID=A0A167RR78_CORFA|nr:Vesicle tethering protein p115-like protein [Cordyceps fumosorosea ARSEF 2679]OAA58850.1 Vesicle tethering protein p115-like protein [Cordyceps fumosorosea ARSEF 2679]